MAWSGKRPVEWLLSNTDIDGRWCLVHATHLTDREIEGIAENGAIDKSRSTSVADISGSNGASQRWGLEITAVAMRVPSLPGRFH